MTNDRKRAAPNGATSRDVANALNIAQSSVSRAFTPGASISPDLKRRILQMAEQVGYRPNLLARGLIAGRSKLIAVVLARQTNLLYPELLYELSGRLADEGYQVLLFPTDDDGAIENTIERVLAYRVDAVLSTGVISEAQARLIVGDVPLVMFNSSFDLPISSVACDFCAGAKELASRLMRAGHDRLGLICGPKGSYVSEQVRRGVRAAVDAEGRHLATVEAPYAYESGAVALDALVRGDPAPTAIICVNDTVAAGCLEHIRVQRAAKVPRDISIAAFEASGPAGWRGQQLTGMRQPVEEMTAAAVEILLAQIADPDRVPEQRLLRPRFVKGVTATTA